MTNALAQNTDTNNYAIDMLAQANTTPVSSKNWQDDAKFSNIINNIEARSNKAQKDFDKNTKVTNTSSINQKALVRNDSKNQTKEVTKKEIQEEVKTQPLKEENNDKQELNKISKKETNINDKETKTNNIETEKNDVISEKNKTEIKETTSKEDLSDINNSSPVESSPVFSSNEEVVLNETSKEEIKKAIDEVEVALDELIKIVPVMDETSTIENQDLKTKIDELLNNLENSEEAIKTIDEISSMLDNSTMNQDFKNEIAKTLNELKENLSNFKDLTENISFEDSISQLKDKVAKILENIEPEVNEKIDIKETPTLDLSKVKIDKKEKEETNEQIKNTSSLESSKEALQNLKDELKNLTQIAKDAIDSKDAVKLNETIKEISKIADEINILSKENEEITIELDKKLIDSLNNLKQVLQKVANNDDNLKNLENLENIETIKQTENSQDLTFEKVTLEDFKNIETTDKKSLNELLKVLDNYKNDSDVQIDEETKAQIENLIKKINSGNISKEQLSQAIDNISDEIKLETKAEIKIDSKNELEIDSQDIENIADFEQKDDFSEKDFNQDDSFEFENEVQLKASTTKEIDFQEVEQNLEKTIATREMLDEMMVEVDIKTIPAQSGALSVVDEVTKLAMGEVNTLNSINSSNTITYDATGVNAVIKNIAQLTKTAQVQTTSETPSMEDLLNQVTNKITQLKDSSTQKLTMVLRPLDLGRLQIELTTNQNGLTTHIMAQNEQVRAYIEKNIDSLRAQLSENGVNVNSIQIKTAGSNDTTTYNGNQNLAGQQEENLNQQNNKQNQNQQNHDNKDAKEVLAKMSNYDMAFTKDFSSILNKTLNYSLS